MAQFAENICKYLAHLKLQQLLYFPGVTNAGRNEFFDQPNKIRMNALTESSSSLSEAAVKVIM